MLATLTLAAALAVPSPVAPETRYDPRIPTLSRSPATSSARRSRARTRSPPT